MEATLVSVQMNLRMAFDATSAEEARALNAQIQEEVLGLVRAHLAEKYGLASEAVVFPSRLVGVEDSPNNPPPTNH